MAKGFLMIRVSRDRFGIENSVLTVGRNGKIGSGDWAEFADQTGTDASFKKLKFINL